MCPTENKNEAHIRVRKAHRVSNGVFLFLYLYIVLAIYVCNPPNERAVFSSNSKTRSTHDDQDDQVEKNDDDYVDEERKPRL